MAAKHWSMAAAGVLAGSLIAFSGQAAPISGKPVIHNGSSFEKVAYRRCWSRNGRRHCRWYDEPPRRSYSGGTSDYYEYNANSLPFGSSIWWQQMMRENRAGNPRN